MNLQARPLAQIEQPVNRTRIESLTTTNRQPQSGAPSQRHFSAPEWGRIGVVAVVVALCVLINACTTSKYVVGPLYNRVDDQIRKEFNKLGKWTQVQQQAFEPIVQGFHTWHRQHELPRYADLLSRFSRELQQTDITGNDIDSGVTREWLGDIEMFTRNARDCYPANFATELMREATDAQVDFIKARFQRERKRNWKRYSALTHPERAKDRTDKVARYAGFIGLDFTASQLQQLEQGFLGSISLRREYYQYSEVWVQQLFALAERRQQPDFSQAMQQHLDKLWRLIETRRPEQVEANREHWSAFIATFLNSLDREQQRVLIAWSRRMSKTLTTLAAVPNKKAPPADATISCVGTGA